MALVFAIMHLSRGGGGGGGGDCFCPCLFFSPSGINKLGGIVDRTSMSWPCMLFLTRATLKRLEVCKFVFGCLCSVFCLGWWI